MKKSLSERFEGWGTRWKPNVADPFLAATLRMTLIYVFVGAGILISVGSMVDHLVWQKELQIITSPTIEPIEQSLHDVSVRRWSGRAVTLTLFVLATYILAGLIMRPIRRSTDLQKRFIAAVSHELRTPLTVMKTELEVALRQPDRLSSAAAAAMLRGQLEEVNRLADIIQFLTVFSTVENQAREMKMQPVSLRVVLEKALNMLQPLSKEQGVIVHTVIKDTAYVNGNSIALEELMTNLVKNALVYTPSGGEVCVTLEEGNGREVRFLVTDTGIGIGPDDMDHIFDPFFQGKTSTKLQRKGSMGLGLSIVRDIARIHNAFIEVKSEEGNGSSFLVRFPKVSIDPTPFS